MNIELTPRQKDAVDHGEGPALVVAGPGSGKTLVITKRVKHLIDERGVDPERIIVTTFTKKASNELKVRLSETIGAKAAKIQISTIHSLCKKLLEEYFTVHEMGANINVLDQEARRLLLQTNKFNLGIYYGVKGGGIKKLKGGNIKKFARFYDFLTRNNMNTDKLKENLKKRGNPSKENEKAIRSYEKYLNLLEEENRLDFAHLQLKFYQLIKENEEVLKDIQKRFDYILVDEYQDTSPLQDKIFRMLAEPQDNIFVVGDMNQSIYGFRGASLLNFKYFDEHYEDAEKYCLNVNFRSTENIVNLSNEFFSEKIEEKLKARRRKGEVTRLLEDETANSVAEKTVNLIESMKKEGIIKKYGDVALLFRVWRHAEDYISHLNEKDIPYVTFGGGGFLEREEVTSLIYLLSYVTQQLSLGNKFRRWDWWDVSSFKSEVLGFSEATKEALDSLDSDINIYNFKDRKSLKESGFTIEEDIEKIVRLNELRENFEEDPESHSLLKIFYEILKITGYLNRLLEGKSQENEKKLYNLARLSETINTHEDVGNKISDFFWFVYLSANDLDEKILENENTVKIMTVHKAKGLEFPVVFLCSLMEGRFPKNFSSSGHLVPIPKEFYLSEKEFEKDKDAHYEEEKRIFYVGMTRAQDNLIFTTSDKIKVQSREKSRFLKNIEEFVSNDKNIEKPIEKRYRVVEEIPQLNYSAINTYIDCPFRYELVYDYGFDTPGIFMQSVGTFVHNVLQRIHKEMKKGNNLSEENLENFVDQYWIPVYRKKKKDKKFKQDYLNKIKDYYEKASEFYDEIISIEEPFSYIDENMVVDGRADLICRDKNGNVDIIDFKARKSEGIEETNVDKQLKIYNYCLREKYDIDKLIAYTFIDNTKTEFNPENESVKEFLNEMTNKMDVEQFEKKPGAFCKKCEFNFCCGDGA